MKGVVTTSWAELLQFDSLRIVTPALVARVSALSTLCASERDEYTVSASSWHLDNLDGSEQPFSL